MTSITRRHRAVLLLAAGAAVVATVSAPTWGSAAAPGTPVLLHDGLASTDPFNSAPPADPAVQPDTEVEPSIGVNPANPLNVVTAFQVGRVDAGGDADNGFATSLDGGYTWTQGLLPGLTREGPHPGAYDRASDAVVAFGPDGTVYVSSLVFDDTTQNALPSAMAVNVSHDGGKTWSDAVILEQDNLAGLNDKNWIVVDQSNATGHHRGRVYVVWDRVAPMVYAYCDTNCETLANWSNAGGNGFYVLSPGPGIGSIPLIQTNGSLTVIFQSDANTGAATVTPTDQPNVDPNGAPIEQVTAPAAGAVVWPAPLPFSTVPVAVGTYSSKNGVPDQRAGSLPTAAINATTNQMYVGWEDSSFRAIDGRNDAVFVTSTDGGATWTAKARIDTNTDGSYIDAYNTALDVGKDGLLRAMYRQRAEPTSGLSKTIDTYYQQSADSGATWSAPLKVDTQPTNVDYAAFSRGGAFEGDYNQLSTASNGTAYLVRDEAYAPTPGAPCSCTFTQVNNHIHQTTWVAAVNAGTPAVTVPESAWGVALLAGAAGMAVAIGARRRRALAG